MRLARLYQTLRYSAQHTFPNVRQPMPTQDDWTSARYAKLHELQQTVRVPITVGKRMVDVAKAAFTPKVQEMPFPKPEVGKPTCAAVKHSAQVAYEHLLIQCHLTGWNDLSCLCDSWAAALVPCPATSSPPCGAPAVVINELTSLVHLVIHNLGERLLLGPPRNPNSVVANFAFQPQCKCIVAKEIAQCDSQYSIRFMRQAGRWYSGEVRRPLFPHANLPNWTRSS